jgi:beta-barrel assembly-enhancing protease
MASFFYRLGKAIGPPLRQANWIFRSLTDTEAEALRAENAVGRDLASALLQQMELDREPALEAVLVDLRYRLGQCLRNRQRRFQFFAVKAAEINAFALPGGFVFVTRPLLEFCNWDQDELAFILGHEMAHIVQGHVMDRLLANSMIRATVGRLAPVGGLLGQPVLALAANLLNQGYSQDNELEADRVGLQLAASAGFDPTAAARLFCRLRTLGGDRSPLSGYFSTHPPLDVRIGHLAHHTRPRG